MLTPCPEWEERLAAIHPDDLSPDERDALNRHVASCQACAAVLADYKEMDLLIRRSLTIKQPLELWQDVGKDAPKEQGLLYQKAKDSKNQGPPSGSPPADRPPELQKGTERYTTQAQSLRSQLVQKPDNRRLLYRARLLLEEEQSNEALSVLQKILPEDEEQQNELMYLLGWYYLQQGHWNDAIQALLPLSNSDSPDEGGEQRSYSGQARRALSLLWLGKAAVNLLLCEEAAHHYRQCLQVIQEQQLPLHVVRIKALYGLATTCTMRGLHGPALQYYREALGLCREGVDDEDRANIYYGLCYTYRMVGKLLEACDFGREALQLYERMANRPLEGRMRNLLGRIYYLLGDYKTASDHYTVALAIAISYGGHGMIMVNYAALADLCLAEGRLEDAKCYCKLAQENAEHLNNDHLCGLTEMIIGKVTKGEAEHAGGEQRKLLENAVEHFEKAKEFLSRTQAYSDITEVNWRLATLLEELGRDREAIAYWRSAYEVEMCAKRQR